MSMTRHSAAVTHDALVGYLTRTGWTQGEPGVYGALWTIGQAEPVGVTHSSDSDSPDWEDLLRRIAGAIADSPDAVRADLALEMSTLTQRGPK